MAIKRPKPEEIVVKLRQVEVLMGQGMPRIDTDDNENVRSITIAPDYHAAFDHGYACTIHKSQGATVDHAYVLGSNTMDHHLSYVAMTRHRDEMRLYGTPATMRRLERNHDSEAGSPAQAIWTEALGGM